MHHTETVNSETFAALKGRQRYLILKHDQLMIPGDTLVVNEQDTRNQLSFEIDAIVPLHSRASVLSLYAPYGGVSDEDVKKLVHHRDTTVGLWATDRPDLIQDVSGVLFQISY